MSGIVWLASYPKSGNTWVRALLTNLRSGGEKPVDINDLDGGPIASSRLWFDEWSGLEASALPPEVVRFARPGVYARLAAESAPEQLYMKVHDAWALIDGRLPLFPPDATAGVIYIARDPLDVAVSCAYHWGVSAEEAVERLCTPGFTMGAAQASPNLAERLGSWSEHVCSWTERSGLRVHVVRYEDLLRDPVGALKGIAAFCGLPADAARLQRAVAFSSFEELSRQESELGFAERSRAAPGPFFRAGRSGSGRERLSRGLISRLSKTHAATMASLGYAPRPSPACAA